MNAKTKTNANATPADVAEQMEILRTDIGALTATVSELAQIKGSELSQTAKDQISAVKDSAVHQVDAARKQAMQLHDQADEFARTQPAAALGIAAGLGFLVGMMMSRK
ncbi:DUF883 domain-containing protein [Sulfitobacter sp. F26204]|uniref:glycine zipper domain-containing protein n=1 Tax=Sulfitobacter sp. F26204 TaxID=2996014 RepID=UPI00225DDBA3|nr:DUF883 domain-containing protein [Sulfitobacter sp. F26204]MCX7560195.1 DUF883 domain-containing protein [Sulfitobacter sp. F26204]